MNRALYGLLALCLAPTSALAQNIGPFVPLQATTTAGKTVKVSANATPTSVAGTLVCTDVLRCPNIRVFNNGAASIFVRMSTEATPTATAADVPVGAGQSIIMPSPVQDGTVGLAVLSSTTTAGDVYFTPGQGGL